MKVVSVSQSALGTFVLIAAALIFQVRYGAATEPVVFFAAASTTNAVSEVVGEYEANGGGTVKTVFASSSTLARQIANGAPADIFLSANRGWMEYLIQENAIQKGSEVDLLGNTLVLIAPAQAHGAAFGWQDLRKFLGSERLVLGDPNHVPAGIYAKQALEKMKVWRSLSENLVYSKDVRGALALVERGDAVAGIVYATDAKISKKVIVIAEFPGSADLDIAYPLAVVADRNRPEVEKFLAFLMEPESQRIFRDFGFVSLIEQSGRLPATN